MARVECSKRGRRACVDSIEIFVSRPVVDVLRRGPRQIRRRLFREARRDEDDLRAYRDLRAARPDADVEAAAGPPVDGQRLGSVDDVERVPRLEGLEVAHEVVRGRVVRLGEVAHERRPLVGEQAVPVVAQREVRALRFVEGREVRQVALVDGNQSAAHGVLAEEGRGPVRGVDDRVVQAELLQEVGRLQPRGAGADDEVLDGVAVGEAPPRLCGRALRQRLAHRRAADVGVTGLPPAHSSSMQPKRR